MAQVENITLEELNKYNGSDPSLPIYVAIKGKIYDVSGAKNFYGPGGDYAMFAGKDASRALAKMSKKIEDVIASLDGCTEKELETLDNWEKKFSKYPVVGKITC